MYSAAELTSYTGALLIGHPNNYYFTSQFDNKDNRDGIKKTDKIDKAVPYFIGTPDEATGQVYLYCNPDNPQYLQCYVNSNSKGCLTLTNNAADKTLFTVIENGNGDFQLFTTINGTPWYINMQGGNSGSRFCSNTTLNDTNNTLNFQYSYTDPEQCKLDGKAYGLMSFTGGTHGYALMADSAEENVHSLV